jgi:hypothetical protein
VSKALPERAERRAVFELLGLLLADVRTDTIVASRDLQISDASFVRLRRALDRVTCAQRLLETVMREIAATGCSQERLRADGGNVGGERTATGHADAFSEMQALVELLAREWPDEYPAGAVEWLLLEPPGVRPTPASGGLDT